ncbi:L,D-transpeptidase [Halpernia frigidisoli]|uniref:L,D-transpeptidase catalytic domain n=1 Tax=Halpernia frigidisoli TaxID=1125876 RepID=A0A1I3F8Z5_9FLAO|nr:L,D-transpeptidase [Halpernia frigidisoli]SFI07672.1 L,D-transpeptidase catalytic domain [Halpernia frigidisoli]
MNFRSNKFLNIFALAFLFLLAIQCKKDIKKETSSNTSTPVEAAKQVRNINKEDSLSKSKIQYSSFIFPAKKKDSAMSAFKKQYSENERYTILALNRLDAKNSWRADTLIIPNKISDNFLDYSPFPVQIALLKDVKKFVYFSYPIQAFAVYENGELKKWGPTSMGKKAAKTATGLHFANWKSKIATSTVDSDWKLPFNVNIANQLGIGWHEYDLPGYPASHSCLRLLSKDAEWMYSFADQWILSEGKLKANGTPVIVNGDFNWGQQKPWRKLVQNSMANYLSETVMSKNIQPEIDKILAEQKNREEVVIAQK